ncbi:hypothetical protein L195_g000652 [Trifolium pratense]|uniref:Uncharacterized protein n=1 Tax=Trifolium pratense TaxID=57577 RepID=A0A2K3NMG5_TRIPR|nr:hypothetical protein L195_g000652 [Trifolium pratense]
MCTISIVNVDLGIIDRVEPYMKRKVLCLSQSFDDIKNLTLPLPAINRLKGEPLRCKEEAFKMRWSPPLFYPLVGEIYVSPPRERVRVKRLWWEKQQADKK